MDLQTKPLSQQALIKEDCILLEGQAVFYRLFEDISGFSIEICFGEDHCRSRVGSGFARAAALYERLVQGEVTPCTMQDILDDLSNL